MVYFITFLEGLISFISPCMLPLLPVYISYFAADVEKKGKTFFRAFSFVLGFTLVFALLGLFAGTLGRLLVQYKSIVNVIGGIAIIIFGLSYLGLFKLSFFELKHGQVESEQNISAFVFGMIYSISHSPCVGAFLGSALTLAASSSTAFKGVTLLVMYSLGLGVPFIMSALLIEKLNNVFSFVKKNYKIINLVSGLFLIFVGILMIFGLLDKIIAFF